jgi:hypothetical protein
MLLNNEDDCKLFLCASANWQCVVESFSYEQAASKAVQEAMDKTGEEFSIGAAISVTELSLRKKNSILIFSPRILADIGMHTLSSNLLNIIDKDTNDDD